MPGKYFTLIEHTHAGGFQLPKAAIFDLDGTLLDSVDLHALAWHEAMLKFGHDVLRGVDDWLLG